MKRGTILIREAAYASWVLDQFAKGNTPFPPQGAICTCRDTVNNGNGIRFVEYVSQLGGLTLDTDNFYVLAEPPDENDWLVSIEARDRNNI